MEIADNFDEDDLKFDSNGYNEVGRRSSEKKNSTEKQLPRKCIRKGDVVCYIKNENIHMVTNDNKKSSTPTLSVTDSKTPSSQTDNVLSGESLYKTFIFEESLNDNDTQKCIGFWKSVMEKNLEPIKCTIIENKRKRQRELKVEHEQKPPPTIEISEEKIKEVTDKVHAEYKAMWMEALKEIKEKKLDKLKLVGKARCQLCETSQNPMEEYSTDIDNVAIKEEVKDLNEWQSVSSRPKRGEMKGGDELSRRLKQKEKEQTQYKFVNVIEEKKKSGAYKLWRSNKVFPPCKCGKRKCECNTNPAIICMRTPLASRAGPKTIVKPEEAKKAPIETKKSPLKPPMPTIPSAQSSYKEQSPQPIPVKPSAPISQKAESSQTDLDRTYYKPPPVKPSAQISQKEESPQADYKPTPVKPSAQTSQKESPQADLIKAYYKAMPATPSAQKSYKEETSQTEVFSSHKDQESQTYVEQDHKYQAPKTSDILSEDELANSAISIMVTKATPFIKEITDSVMGDLSALLLPFAEESTFLKMASSEFIQEVSAMILDRAKPYMQDMSETLFQEISQLVIHKALSYREQYSNLNLANEGQDTEMEVKEESLTPERVVSPIQSSLKKRGSDSSVSVRSVPERQVSILLSTGQIEVSRDKDDDDQDMDTSWDIPQISPSNIPLHDRKGSLEIIKAKKEMQTRRKSEKLNKPEGDVAMAVLHTGGIDKSPATSEFHQKTEKLKISSFNEFVQTDHKQEEFQDDSRYLKETRPHYINAKDSLFVHKDRVERHKKEMRESSFDELEEEVEHQQVQIVPDANVAYVDAEPVRVGSTKLLEHKQINLDSMLHQIIPKDSMFVQKEHVAKHKKDPDEDFVDEVEVENRQVRILPEISLEAIEDKIKESNLSKTSSIRDSIFVHKERVAKHKKEMCERESDLDLDLEDIENRQVQVMPEANVAYVETPIEVTLMNYPEFSNKCSKARDSLFVYKERVNKHKKDMDEVSPDDSDIVDRQVQLSPNASVAYYEKETQSNKIFIDDLATVIKNTSSTRNSIFVHKERLAKKDLEEKYLEYTIDNENRQVQVLPNPLVAYYSTELLDALTKNVSSSTRDSLFVHKERVDKQKKEIKEEYLADEEVAESGNRQVRLLSEPIATKIGKPKKRHGTMIMKDSVAVHKSKLDSPAVHKSKFPVRIRDKVSDIMCETDYEKIEEQAKLKRPFANKETCDPCYCTKCPCFHDLSVLNAPTRKEAKKMMNSCPLYVPSK